MCGGAGGPAGVPICLSAPLGWLFCCAPLFLLCACGISCLSHFVLSPHFIPCPFLPRLLWLPRACHQPVFWGPARSPMGCSLLWPLPFQNLVLTSILCLLPAPFGDSLGEA